MKKKVLSLALATVMGLSMATTAFAADSGTARIGSGDVDGSGRLTSNDAAWVLQYTLDEASFADNADFVRAEANFTGDLIENNGNVVGRVASDDAVAILQQTLEPQTDVYITAVVGKVNPVRFTEVINGEDANGSLTKTKMLDFIDTIITSGSYDAELNNNASKVNTFIDNIDFKGNSGRVTNIRTEIGWSKFANAVADVVTDSEAFAQLENSVKNTTYSTADQIKADYEVVKKAFAPSASADQVKATGEKITAITGADFITLSSLYKDADGQETVYNTMTLDELFTTVADNNLQAYDTVTIDQLQDVFGSNILIEVSNPNNGYTSQIAVTVERR